jgi:large subunit ribosomal protein L22
VATVETQAPTEVRAEARFVRTAPRKAQLVAEQIRGRPVPEARTILAFMTRDAARDVARVLESAVANAEANHGLSGDDLYVSAAFVGAGPVLKRWRARARGRVARIKKRTCHITVRLAMPDHAEIPLVPVAPPPEPIAVPEPEVADPEAAEVEAADEAEAKPKPKRAPRKKAEEPAAEDTERPEAAPEVESREKRRDSTEPKRTRAKKTEAPAGGEPAEEKPRRRTTRKKEEES